MNAVFNALNVVTSELFLIWKELKNAQGGQKNQLMRRIKYFLDMIIDLCRILEMLTKWVPELFLQKDQIHSTRLLDYIQSVFRSIFREKMDVLFIDFCQKLQTRSRTLPQFLVPFIGMLVNLYTAIECLSGQQEEITIQDRSIKETLSQDIEKLNKMYLELKSNSTAESPVTNSLNHFKQIASETNIVPQQGSFDSLTALFNRMNSFDPTLFHRLKEYVLNELGPKNQYEVEVFENYTKMLAETDMLIMCKKIKIA